MQQQFEGWVRVLCGGLFAMAAYVTYAAAAGTALERAWYQNHAAAAVMAAAAVAFACWPDRLAYAYRLGALVPRWSRPTSVTNPDDPLSRGFAAYRPSLKHLRSAFFSIAFYVLLAIRLPRPQEALLVFGVLAAAAAILWLAARREPADGAAGPEGG